MGILTDYFGFDNTKKWWIDTIKNILIIVIFIGVALYARSEYDAGYNACSHQACTICTQASINSTLKTSGVGQSYLYSSQQ